jgi:hypothetical protein
MITTPSASFSARHAASMSVLDGRLILSAGSADSDVALRDVFQSQQMNAAVIGPTDPASGESSSASSSAFRNILIVVSVIGLLLIVALLVCVVRCQRRQAESFHQMKSVENAADADEVLASPNPMHSPSFSVGPAAPNGFLPDSHPDSDAAQIELEMQSIPEVEPAVEDLPPPIPAVPFVRRSAPPPPPPPHQAN